MNPARCLLVAWACAAAYASAYAVRSSVSDESDVADAGDCEAELVHERTRARGDPVLRDRALRLACGVGWNTELEAAHARQRSGAARGESLAFEAKTTLRNRGDNRIGWAVALGLGAERIGGSWQRSEYGLTVEATRQLGEASLIEVKLGAVRDVLSRRHSTVWAVAVEHALHERMELRAGLEGDDRDQPLVELGLRYTLWPELVQLKLSHGVRGGARRERITSLGLQVEF
jgi:hypothetical protein